MYIYIKRLFIYSLILLSIFQDSSISQNKFTLKVVKKDGLIQIFDIQKKEWLDIKIPYELNKDDIVRTMAGSTCEIECGQSYLKINENTEIKIKSLIEKIDLKVTYGEILMKLKNLPRDSSFTVETPQAVAGTRGTKYKVKVIKERYLTRVSVLEKTVILQSIKEPKKYVTVNKLEQREICPWERTNISGEGVGVLSAESEIQKKIRQISEKEYIKSFGASRIVTTKRAAVIDAYRELAKKIYGVVIDSKTTLEDYAVKDNTIRKTVKGTVRGAKEISSIYYSDGSIKVKMEIKGINVKNTLIPITGDIYGIDCITGPEAIETKEFEKFLL